MRRETQHVLLLLLGGALLRITADDTFLRYVRPSHRWLLLAAGAVMVTLAAVALARDLRGARHTHEHGGASAWLLLVPVLTLALVAPPALGADSVVRAGDTAVAVPASAVFPPLPAGPAPEVGLGEAVQRALFDTTGSLDGRTITVVGFAVRRGAEVDLARLRISCCAADARASRIRLDGDVGSPAPDTWLRLTGTVRPAPAPGVTDRIPIFAVRSVDVIAAPPDPYEY